MTATERRRVRHPLHPAGRPGVLLVEATGIRDIRSGPLLRIADDRFVPGLARLVDVVRHRSEGQRDKQVTCKLWDRLIDPGDPTLSLASDGRRRLSAPPWDPPDA